VLVANSFHVTALEDVDDCAVQVLRAFVADPAHGLTPPVLACTSQVPPVRAQAQFYRSFTGVPAAAAIRGTSASAEQLRAVAAAALTVADVVDRWYNNYTGSGVGLHGGTWSYAGGAVTTFQLHRVLLTTDLAVSGTVTWDQDGHSIVARLVLAQVGPTGQTTAGSTVAGTLAGSWNTRATGSTAVLTGVLGGHQLAAALPAP
jgi:hypothetical protein